MNEENTKKLWKIIQEAGDYLQGQLPDHPNHPKGRNPYAHVALCVKEKFKRSYKDIPDEKFGEVLNYIEFLKKSKLIFIVLENNLLIHLLYKRLLCNNEVLHQMHKHLLAQLE